MLWDANGTVILAGCTRARHGRLIRRLRQVVHDCAGSPVFWADIPGLSLRAGVVVSQLGSRRCDLEPISDLPLFRITDHRAGPATEVSLAAQQLMIYANRRPCTWMYETRNETMPRPGLAVLRASRGSAR